MLADRVDHVIGVDTHRDAHAAAIVAALSGALEVETTIAANPIGYKRLLRFARPATAPRSAPTVASSPSCRGRRTLVAGDTNGADDAFVRDRRTGTTERVSVGPGGQANVGSDRWYLAVSADGRFVAFGSGASNLVAGDTNRAHDVFVRDRRDTTAPSVMTPWFPFASPFPLDGDRPALSPVRWSASDESRICRDELEQSVDGGAFAPIAVASPTATSIHREHAFGRRYRYRLRTTDCAGNTSTWKTSWAFSPGVADDRADALR